MYSQLLFWAVLIALLFAVIMFDLKYSMLRDMSTAGKKPYSFGRVQLAWWSVIVLASFITIVIRRGIPTFDVSTLELLGISSATTAAARLIDLSDKANPKISMTQDEEGQNFFLDILSDENGVSIHRFQTVVFNLVFGVWLAVSVLQRINDLALDVSQIIPHIDGNNLILLGVSAGTYVALKSTENKESESQAETVADEAAGAGTTAEG